jgi:hypothetical protein
VLSIVHHRPYFWLEGIPQGFWPSLPTDIAGGLREKAHCRSE